LIFLHQRLQNKDRFEPLYLMEEQVNMLLISNLGFTRFGSDFPTARLFV